MKRNEKVFLNQGLIRLKIYEQGTTQKEVAQEMGISRQYLNVLLGKRSCLYKTALKLAKALDVDVLEIIEREV